jgi:hypothetical protein
MPHILPTFDFQPKAPAETTGVVRFSSMLRKLYEQLARTLNGLVSFGNGITRDNIDGEWATVPNTGAANTDFTVTHNMLRLPIGYILMDADRAVSIYNGSVPRTTTTITLRANVANASIVLFIV